MHVPLNAETDQRLRREAARRGVEAEEYARQLIEDHLPSAGETRPNQAIIDLLDQWDREDATDDPAEIARRQQDFEEFKAGINQSHSSSRKIYP